MQSILRSVYYNARHPAGYGGKQKLQALTGATDREIDIFAHNEKLYQKFKPARKRFKRAQFIYDKIDSVWAADVVFMRSLAPYNKGVQYILFCIDSTSKYLWGRTLKTLKATEITKQFEDIIKKSGRKPSRLMVDMGGEFRSALFRKMTKFYNIKVYSTHSEMKSMLVERSHKTIMQKLWPLLAHQKSWTYINHLQQIISSYNRSKHRSIGAAPEDVTKDNEAVILTRLNKQIRKQEKKPKFKVGDFCRISIAKMAFQKGYSQTFTDEIYEIYRVTKQPPTYLYFIKTVDEGAKIKGGFYAEQLVGTSQTEDSDI